MFRYLLDHCKPDLEFIVKMVDKGAVERLEQVASSPFKRVSYTEAIDILKEVVASGKKKFEFPVRAREVRCVVRRVKGGKRCRDRRVRHAGLSAWIAGRQACWRVLVAPGVFETTLRCVVWGAASQHTAH